MEETYTKETFTRKIKYTEGSYDGVEAKPRFRSGRRPTVAKTKRDL